jgi:hypothetical protein
MSEVVMDAKEKKKELISIVYFFTLPFGIGAAAEFLPSWVSIPAIVIMAMLWCGNLVMMGDKKK